MPSRLRRSSSATACSPSGRSAPPVSPSPVGLFPPVPRGGRRRPAGFTLLEVLVALAILGIGLGVIFQGLSRGLRLRGESAENVRLALVAEDILGGLVERRAAPEAPEEGEESGCRWRLESVEGAAGGGAAAGPAAPADGRGAELVVVRLTVSTPSGRSWQMSTLLPHGDASP